MWRELLRDRWLWTDRAVDWLNGELYGAGHAPPDTGGTNVLLVGATRAGKTTLVLHLLGVTGPEQVRVAHDVLSGGRRGSESNTAAPTRYRWSLSTELWTLVRDPAHGPQLLTGDELRTELGHLRSGSTVRWDVTAAPLEIGIPARLALGGARRELRILDLPGTFARDPQERELAGELVARFAPRMAVVLFVLQAHNMTTLQHEEIAADPYLRNWFGNPGRFRLVPTSVLRDASTREEILTTARHATPEAAAYALRALIAEQLADTLFEDKDRAGQLLPLLYPVDIGKSWGKLPDDAAVALRPARDLVIEQLATSLTSANAPDSERLETPRLALRVAEELQAQAADRAVRRTKLITALQAAEQERDKCRVRREDAAQEAAAARRAVAAFTAARDDLVTRPVNYVRPAAPDFRDPAAVRSRQSDERTEWARAAQQLWTDWRAEHAGLAMRRASPLDEADVRQHYDDLTRCCGRCGGLRASMFVPFYGIVASHKATREPENTCYRQMTEAGAGMAAWITGRLTAALATPMARAANAENVATERLNTIDRVFDRAYRQAGDLSAELDQALTQEAQADALAADRRATAAKLRMVLDQENQAYVRELAAEVCRAPAADRGWYAAAALRAVADLNQMLTSNDGKA